MDKKVLFYGGIFSPLIFLLNDIIGSIITPDYNPIIHAISELTQAGSQNTYLLGSILLFISALMGIIFGIGIISHYHYKHSKLLFTGGLLLIIIGIFSSLTGTIFPMDPINGETTFAGTMHGNLVGLSVILTILTMLMIGVGLDKKKQWKSFKLYSIITILIMAIFGILSLVVIMHMIQLMGLFERIPVYAYSLWVFILAFKFLKE
jgi:hypothetical protein